MKLQLRHLVLSVLMLLVPVALWAQMPTVTSFSPTIVTQRSVVTIIGTNFTGTTQVRFGGVAAASFTIVSPTQINAVVGATGASGQVQVTNAAGTASLAGITFIAPGATPAEAAVTRVVTDWNGYWSSTAASAVAANQPDSRHNVLAFGYGSSVYATGVNNSILTSNSVPFTSGDYRALPINAITGNTSSSTNSNYIILGTKIDGDALAANYLAPGVAGLKVRDVLIDGIKGLDLGTGVTNINTSMVLDFSVNNVVEASIGDTQPDILVTQIASPSSNVDIYVFTDAAGNIVGTPLKADLSAIGAIGTYRNDLFTIPTNTAYSLATPNGNGAANGTRDIRMIAFKLSDFGISAANASGISNFKVMPGGDSDPGFIAYNASAFLVPAPVITTQPTSVAVCPGASNNATFTVVATGSGLTYQWRKNGVEIPGATSSSYTITGVTAANAGEYTVVVSNSSGSVISNAVYLNALTAVNPSPVATCIGSPVTVTASGSGVTVSYQWYSNTVNNNTTGTLIPGATNATYSPPVNAAGVRYYYATITANGLSCTSISTTAAAVTVSAQPGAGTASGVQTICSGSTATVSVAGYSGSIQWQQSANGTSGWAAVSGGSGATSASYTTPALSANTWYRAVLSSGTCPTVNTNSVAVSVIQQPSAGTVSATQEVCSGSSATVSVSGATGTIQWQESADGISGWANVSGGSGAQSASFTTAAITATRYFRAAVTSAPCATVYSAATMVTTRTTTWNGSSWDNGVPSITTTAIISGNYTATDNLFACTLTVTNNALVTIPSGFDVTLYGAINVTSGNVIFENDANLIQQTNAANSGSVAIKRSTVPLMRLDYVLWSSPVSSQNLFNFSPLTTANRFYTFNPAADIYNTIASPSTTTFQDATGYLIRMPNNHPATTPTVFTGTFAGTPHNGPYTVALANGLYNAVGNPYPSAISADAFMIANNISGALYFWRKKNNDVETSYATYTFAGGVGTSPNGDADPNFLVPNGVIASGQGFLFNATAASANFTNAMRTLNASTLLRSAASTDRIWLKMTGGGIWSETLLAFMPEATLGVDTRIDGKYINDSDVALTSLIEGEEYAIQGRPEFSVADVIPLGFKAASAGEYSIGIGRAEGILADASQPVFLRDNLLQTVADLRQGAYSFTAAAGVSNGRFELGFGTALSVDPAKEKSVLIYKSQQSIVVDFGDMQLSDVSVYDMQGRLIASRKNVNDTHCSMLLQAVGSQVLIVQATSSDGFKTARKIIY